jgi:hypothetical protein
MGIAIGGNVLSGVLGENAAAKDARATLGKYAKQAEYNAKMRLIQAEDARYRGREEMVSLGRETAMLQGRQRTSAAAQGILVDAGSMAEIADETARLSSEDMARIRVNAAREAMGYEMSANELKKEAAEYRRQAKKVKGATLLTTAQRAIQAGAPGYIKGLVS